MYNFNANHLRTSLLVDIKCVRIYLFKTLTHSDVCIIYQFTVHAEDLESQC